jgi:23S rRNA (guanosine2251-2'-O)-methyltransferase
LTLQDEYENLKTMTDVTPNTLWKEALRQVRHLDDTWAQEANRAAQIQVCHDWMAAQHTLPRLCALAKLLTPGMTRQQFWSVLVPVEREVAQVKITDIDILDRDLPETPDTARHSIALRMPLTVVLDSIRSAFNVGGIFRTAECFGVERMILCGYTPLPDQPQVKKAALGTDTRLDWRYEEDILAAIKTLRASGVTCYALETVAGAPSIAETVFKFPAALVLGNERFGLNSEVIAACDAVLRIPLFGLKNSLNVVSAFSIASYAIRNHRNTDITGKDSFAKTAIRAQMVSLPRA